MYAELLGDQGEDQKAGSGIHQCNVGEVLEFYRPSQGSNISQKLKSLGGLKAVLDSARYNDDVVKLNSDYSNSRMNLR